MQSESDSVVNNKSIVELFDELCFSFGDDEAIRIVSDNRTSNVEQEHDNEDHDATSSTATTIGYFELQEYSKALACQLYWRYNRPDSVLVDCHGWPGAETVALLACMRLQIPFVPVSCHNQHAGKGQLGRIVQELVGSGDVGGGGSTRVVALTCCANDQDPVLGVFQAANVHSILFLDNCGNLREPLDVPSHIPLPDEKNDNLYILFTSGTSGQNPKAVIGSHRSTLQRIQWFQHHPKLPPLETVAKRTPLTFVDAIAELLGTLLTRESVLVALAPSSSTSTSTGQVVMDVATIVEQTQCSQISMLPSQLSQVLDYLPSCRSDNHSTKTPLKLKRIIISGEPCSEDLWKSFCHVFYDTQTRQFTCQLINLYGQTETAGDCCGAILTDLPDDTVVVNHIVTIGQPLRDTIGIHAPSSDTTISKTMDVEHVSQQGLDNKQLIVSHELIVSGEDCFANGYLGHSSTTTTTTTHLGGFVYDNHHEKNGSVAGKIASFATGDIGFCVDGYWYVQGRKDDVVKVNGVWTSPSEAETAFLTYFREQQQLDDKNHIKRTNTNAAGSAAAAIIENRVYILLENNTTETTDATTKFDFSRQHMKQQTGLSWNLIPHQVFPCDMLPRTPSTGKVDRAKVKAILRERLLQNHQQQDNGAVECTRANDNDGGLLDLFRETVASVLLPTSHDDSELASEAFAHSEFSSDQACRKRTVLDLSKSFVELGGDSALSISLHYQLRLCWVPQFRRSQLCESTNQLGSVTATDILNSEQMMNVYNMLMSRNKQPSSHTDSRRNKKPKLHDKVIAKVTFVPEPTIVWDTLHSSVAFAACVDVTPVVSPSPDGINVFAACQNGVIQKIHCSPSARAESQATVEHICAVASRHLNGWRVSSDMIYLQSHDSIVVCCVRHPRLDSVTAPGAMVVSMSADLSTIHWTYKLPPECTANSPILCDETIWLVVSATEKTCGETDTEDFDVEEQQNHKIMTLRAHDGFYDDGQQDIDLPVRVVARPVLLSGCQVKRSDDTVASRILVYGSCDWDTGLLLVDVDRKYLLSPLDDSSSANTNRFFSDSVGPVYKDLVVWDDERVLVADSWGSLHCVHLNKKMECSSIKLAAKALSSPTILPGASSREIVVGGYDGIVRYVNADLTKVLWTVDVGSVVYAKPLALCNEIIVCTTAGDVVQIDRTNGSILWKYRMPVGAEIWSAPTELPLLSANDKTSNCDGVLQENDFRSIAYGARDSRLHFLKVPTHDSKEKKVQQELHEGT